MIKTELLIKYLKEAVSYILGTPYKICKAFYYIGYYWGQILGKWKDGSLINHFDINLLLFHYKKLVFDVKSSVYCYGLITLGRLK